MTHQTHAFHMVNPSPWPLTGAFSALLLTSGLVMWFHYNSSTLLSLGLLGNLLTMYQWWCNVIREGTYQGHHTPIVQKGLRYGMILFIVSEVFFFTGFFWAFTPTTQLSTNLGMAIPLWAGAMILGFRHKLKASLAHFLPQGTPISLIPMLIIIETISLFIQPMALAVHPTANITAK